MPENMTAFDADNPEETPNIRKVIRQAEQFLRSAGVDNPELAAQFIISFQLNCPRLELFMRLEEKPAPDRISAIAEGIRRLAAHEPIQYVLGHADFMGYSFKCDRRSLIPRPETEELVELVIAHEPLWQVERPALIDIGTGCGCIVISLALRRENADFVALDVSPGAIALARENARANNVAGRIRFVTADFFAKDVPSGMDAVIANPPYVRSADFDKLDKNIRLWEPRLALDGGEDGLQVIRLLIKKSHKILKPGRFLFMEIGFDQWPAVQELLAETGFRRSAVSGDLSGHERLVAAVK